MMREVRLIGVRLTLNTTEELLDLIEGWVRTAVKQMVLSGNVHGYNLAYENRWLREMYEQAGAIRMDGYGVIWGAQLLGEPAYPRSTGAEFIWHLAGRCAEKGISLYFLGAREAIAARAAERMKAHIPGLMITGTHHGYFDKRRGSDENEAVLKEITQQKPDILCIGFGMPRQERWLRENWKRVDCQVAITLGAAFDVTAGEIPRAPRWMQHNGLEWLGRLLIEPRKLWRRYLIGNPKYALRLLRHMKQSDNLK